MSFTHRQGITIKQTVDHYLLLMVKLAADITRLCAGYPGITRGYVQKKLQCEKAP